MKRRAIIAALGLAAGAHADTGTWSLLDPPDGPGGNGLIEEGELATLTFMMDMTPSVGEWLADGTYIHGFGSVVANLIGVENWAAGRVTWTCNSDLIFLTGDITQKDDATQNLYNITLGQIPGFGPWYSADPAWMITVKWDPLGDYTPRTVSVLADTQDSDTMRMYVREPGSSWETLRTWPAPDSLISFRVVPAPAAAGLAPLALALAARRRRARP